jgi:hypothetical protein
MKGIFRPCRGPKLGKTTIAKRLKKRHCLHCMKYRLSKDDAVGARFHIPTRKEDDGLSLIEQLSISIVHDARVHCHFTSRCIEMHRFRHEV